MPVPKKKVDWVKVDKYLELGAHGTDIAGALGMSADTLYYHTEQDHGMKWSEYSKYKRGKGNIRILEKQMEAVNEGNINMLIHLGKSRLGQDYTTKQEVRVEKLPDWLGGTSGEDSI